MVAMANDRSNLLFIEDGIKLENNEDDTPTKPGAKPDKNKGNRGQSSSKNASQP
jgi:hypothetical protein